MRRQKGPGARAVLKRLQREQMNLALFHSKVEVPGHPAVEAQRDKVQATRSAQLRCDAPAVAAAL